MEGIGVPRREVSNNARMGKRDKYASGGQVKLKKREGALLLMLNEGVNIL
jgi:hypothetical protein